MPGARKPGFGARPRGLVGASQLCRSPPLASAAGLCVSNAALRPGAACARAGRTGWSTDGPFCISPPVELPCRHRADNRAARRPRGCAARPALHTAGRPARAARLLRPGMVFLCPPIMRDRPEKVKPRFVPDNRPHRPGHSTGLPAQPPPRASRPAIPGGGKKGLGPQVVAVVRVLGSWPPGSNCARRGSMLDAVQARPASRPSSCRDLRRASEPGPADCPIAVRSRKRNAISAIESQPAMTG